MYVFHFMLQIHQLMFEILLQFLKIVFLSYLCYVNVETFVRRVLQICFVFSLAKFILNFQMDLLLRQEGPLFICLILSFQKTGKQEFQSNGFPGSAIVFFLVKAEVHSTKFPQKIAKIFLLNFSFFFHTKFSFLKVHLRVLGRSMNSFS